MKLRLIAIACVTLATLAACGGSSNTAGTAATAAAATTNFKVSGVAAVGSPLTDVAVTVTDSTGQTTVSTPTDANGNFTVMVKGIAPLVLTMPFNDIDGTPGLLSSVIAANNTTSGQTVAVQANLNPLTSLATQRVLGFVPTTPPSNTQIAAAKITQASIAKAVTDAETPLQPVFAALNISASETGDPIGTTAFQAKPTDALDNLFDIGRFSVHTGEVNVGTDTNRITASIPPTGSVSGPVAATAVTSLVALNSGPTTTPIQHVIVVIGENQTFDAVFGTYQPPAGQTVMNLLSEGIVTADGGKGPNFARAEQNQAAPQATWMLNPPRTQAFANLPQPEATGEQSLLDNFVDPGAVPDTRFPANLPDGPFQATNFIPYGVGPESQTGDPVHRFFQMWQQTGGDNSKLDLYTWVATTTGQGGDTPGVTPMNPGQGGELMGFNNMSTGDAPTFKSLAQQFAISDNYHQSIMGGTGMNFFSIATADLPVFNNNGTIATPPGSEIENPNAELGTANFYVADGSQGGNYVNCSDASQPGVAPILSFLGNLGVKSNCAANTYYLVNNLSPGFTMTGTPQPLGPNNFNYPPQTVPTIAEALSKKGVTWKWYTGSRDPGDVINDATTFGLPAGATALPQVVAELQAVQYNDFGDPLVGSSNIMNTPALKADLAGLTTFQNDLAGGTLPAVSFVVPKNFDSGHPGNSTPARYEAFLSTLIAQVKANPTLWAHTAILVTTDEGGGNFDSGYIQSVDFFGDGTRIPMLAISPYSRTGFIDHSYYDHTSLLKFIERNWRLAPLSPRSRDNLPNAVTTAANPYQPVNKAAVGDLMSMFNF